MKHLALIALLPTVASVSSCALAGKIIQTPVRLLQAGVRTVTDAGDTTPPATRESSHTGAVALKVVQEAAD